MNGLLAENLTSDEMITKKMNESEDVIQSSSWEIHNGD